jgi:hypothetical protein
LNDKNNREVVHSTFGKKGVWILIGLAPTLLLILVALLAPMDSVDRMPVVAEVLKFFSNYVPSLRGYINLSAYSQVTSLYFACAWTFLMPQAAIWLFVIFRYGDFSRFSASRKRRDLVKLTLAWLITAGSVFVALYWVSHEWSVVGGWGMNESRLGLAFFGSGGFLLIALGIGFVPNAVLNLLSGEFNG